MFNSYLRSPWLITVPLLVSAYVTGLLFKGTDTIWFAPSIICLIVISIMSVWSGLRTGWEVPKSPVFLLIFGFGIYIWVSTLWATIPYNAILFASVLSVLPFFCISLILFAWSYKGLKIYAVTLGAMSCVLAGWAVIQYFFIEEFIGTRIHHPMLNPNNLAAILNMGLLPVIALYFVSSKRQMVIGSFVLVLLFFAALLVTQSRGAMISFIMAVTILFLVTRGCDGVNWKKVGAFLIGLAGVYFAIESYRNGLAGLLFSGNILEITSVSDRISLWSSTLEIIREHFWLGTGLGTFYYFYPAKRLPTERSDGYFAHMDPLQFWQEMGVLAPILFYAVLIAVLVRTVRTVRVLPVNSSVRFEVIAPFCALFALAVHTHITFHFYVLGTLIPAAVLLAYWFVCTEKILGADRIIVCVDDKKRFVAAMSMVTLFGIAGIWLFYSALGIGLLNKAVQHFKRNELEVGYRYVVEAGYYAPRSFYSVYEYEAKYRYALLYGNAVTLDGEGRERLYREAHEFLDKAQHVNPVLDTLSNLRARLYFSAREEFEPDGGDLAIDILQDILEFNPMMVDSRTLLAAIYRDKGQVKEALSVLEGGLVWPQARSHKTVDYITEVAKLRLQLGDQEGHDQMIAYIQELIRKHTLIDNSL